MLKEYIYEGCVKVMCDIKGILLIYELNYFLVVRTRKNKIT